MDFVTKLQKCDTLAYSCSASECTKRETYYVGGGDDLCENLNPSQGLNEGLRTGSRTENGSQPDCKRIKMSDPNLTTCQLAAWDENAVKFDLTFSNENERRKQTKTRWGVRWETQ